MSKQIIGALVGGIILFFWQFFSWSLLNIHGSQLSYTPQQDVLLQVMADANLEPGQYFMPNVPPGTPGDEHQAYMESKDGQPWALVSYRKAFSMNMTMSMVRGFIVDVLAVFLLCWILLKINDLDFKTILLSCLGVGIIGYLTIPYLNTIWFEGTSIPDLIDAMVQWGLCGVWLGWWLPWNNNR